MFVLLGFEGHYGNILGARERRAARHQSSANPLGAPEVARWKDSPWAESPAAPFLGLYSLAGRYKHLQIRPGYNSILPGSQLQTDLHCLFLRAAEDLDGLYLRVRHVQPVAPSKFGGSPHR